MRLGDEKDWRIFLEQDGKRHYGPYVNDGSGWRRQTAMERLRFLYSPKLFPYEEMTYADSPLLRLLKKRAA